MYRTALCIKMLIKLKSQNKVTTRELAEYLDTNPRNIREFRKELEEAGYHINEIRGRNGGYSLDDRSFLPIPNLTQQQTEVLAEGKRFMESHPEFTSQKEYEEILNGILSTSKSTAGNASLSYRTSSHAMPREVQQMLNTAEEAIKEQRVLNMSYQGRDKPEPSNVLVDPYHIVCIEDSYYLIGWSHRAKDYRNYKFSEYRMMSMEKTNRTFEKDSFFNYEFYIGNNSAFKDKLKIYTVKVREKAERLFKEQYWGTELNKVASGKEWHTYTFTSDNPYGTYNHLFSFGGDVILISPEDKRQEYMERIRSLLPLYGLDQPEQTSPDRKDAQSQISPAKTDSAVSTSAAAEGADEPTVLEEDQPKTLTKNEAEVLTESAEETGNGESLLEMMKEMAERQEAALEAEKQETEKVVKSQPAPSGSAGVQNSVPFLSRILANPGLEPAEKPEEDQAPYNFLAQWTREGKK